MAKSPYRVKFEKTQRARRKKRSKSVAPSRELSFEENKRLIEAGETFRSQRASDWRR